VLLAGAVLMQRSLVRLASVDVGFDAGRLIAAPVVQLQSHYASDDAITGFADGIVAAVRQRPGVGAAAVAWPFDVTGFTWAPNINLPENPFPAGKEPVAQTASVTPGFFATMGIPIRRAATSGPPSARARRCRSSSTRPSRPASFRAPIRLAGE
jgi:putative ABC transport system permease protein